MLVQSPKLSAPFADFARDLASPSSLRAAITAATRIDEAPHVAALVDAARLPPDLAAAAKRTARHLVETLRAKRKLGAVEALMRAYSLSSEEGVALMCLAEALLRIPDRATRDALIRDKIAPGDWRAHVGQSPSPFVNAATWGLVVTGRLVSTSNEGGLGAALTRLIARGGEPLIRKGVEAAMRMMGEQFVTGQTIEEALANSRRLQARGFRYSFDMLGEGAVTDADARRYTAAYERAITAIGKASGGGGVYRESGISIKLSALHPRYSRSQRRRVMSELLPRLEGLAALARRHDVGLNIDAEEADRLEISLDLLEALCASPTLASWNGLGFVVQAYQKRAPFVIDFVVDLARRSGHRLMVRLVKGAYWDSEIKRAQVDGLDGFPVFTRKAHTDVSYLACARRLLASRDAVFPQFATHNAHTASAILAMAGPDFAVGDYEFQCLHGMGEPLYEEIVGPARLDRPCRIYAPVGSHETLLAYLVRRLLENGANASFVNRIQDEAVPVEALIADPIETVASASPVGAPHERIAQPRALFAPIRTNSRGLDLASETTIAELAPRLAAPRLWRAAAAEAAGVGVTVTNPADRRDVVGHVLDADHHAIAVAIEAAKRAAGAWAAVPATQRAAILLEAADRLEHRMPALLSLIVREAGKTLANAVGEVREAVDFLRYYATELRAHHGDSEPLGLVACISPWNFPLAIFTGQVAAALAAGNAVLAKPAEETPLTAAAAVAILHDAGIPADVLRLLPGAGATGAALVADARIDGVMFTGSTAVARLIARATAGRLNRHRAPVPFVAETGGQNALIVDSSALAEQVVGDVLASAFDSAGQRCSALRVLCIQDDVAERLLDMLKGALAELSIGLPDRLETDIGPVITDEAAANIEAHIARLRSLGRRVYRAQLPDVCRYGNFVAPTMVEIDGLDDLAGEVFGPVLHVLRFSRADAEHVVDRLNATGFGLTFGVHSRIDETIAHLTERSAAGNLYVNRNLIGAVVGVQPFGGNGLSGTGPKAGGPLYLRRLMSRCAAPWPESAELTGPVGERNDYRIGARGDVLCVASTPAALAAQIDAARAAGNRVLVPRGAGQYRGPVRIVDDPATARCDAVLFEGGDDALIELTTRLAARDGAIVQIYRADRDGRYPPEGLVRETSISTNTAAAGGNAYLMTID